MKKHMRRGERGLLLAAHVSDAPVLLDCCMSLHWCSRMPDALLNEMQGSQGGLYGAPSPCTHTLQATQCRTGFAVT